MEKTDEYWTGPGQRLGCTTSKVAKVKLLNIQGCMCQKIWSQTPSFYTLEDIFAGKDGHRSQAFPCLGRACAIKYCHRMQCWLVFHEGGYMPKFLLASHLNVGQLSVNPDFYIEGEGTLAENLIAALTKS